MNAHFLLIFAALFSLFSANSSAMIAGWTESEFDEFIEEAMDAFKVPGASITIVKGDEVLLTKGYGFRDVEKKLLVTKDTLFPIGSITKSFTTATLASMAEEGLVSFDEPVRDYIPAFRLFHDDYTAKVTLLDILTHRSGVPGHDIAALEFGTSHESLIAKLRYQEISEPIRTTFQYNNTLYSLVGDVISKIDDKIYEDSVKDRILKPLTMNSTNFSINDSLNINDFAIPYFKHPNTNEISLTDFKNIDHVAAAGSINSTATDMTHYLSFHINKGSFAGLRILSNESMDRMYLPQMLIEASPFQEIGPMHYGLGLVIANYRKHPIITHSGGINGFIASMHILPEERIGIVVMANLNGTGFPSAVSLKIIDRLLNLKPISWVKRLLKLERTELDKKILMLSKVTGLQKKGSKPSHVLPFYAGTYKNRGYGRLDIVFENDKLWLSVNQKKRELKHFHFDVFTVESTFDDVFHNKKLNFRTGFSGEIEGVIFPLEPLVEPIFFSQSKL